MKKFPAAQNKDHRQNERGNVLIIILIGIMLFAALGFAVSNIMRSGDPSVINEQRSRLLANDILSYAQGMRAAIQDMRISNGCDDTEISFTRESGDDYEYSTPVDDKCKVFHPDGGSISFVLPPPDASDGSDWYFTGSRSVVDVGTTSGLMVFLPGLTKSVCIQINNQLNLGAKDADPPLELGAHPGFKFRGTYLAGGGIGDDAGGAALQGHSVGCFESTNWPAADTYNFYQVLIVR